MTSPGLIERSISSTKPLTKLAAMLCRPKPRPMPIAPVSTFSVVRSRPAAFRPTSTDRPTRNACSELGDADAHVRRERVELAARGARASARPTARRSTNRLTVTSSFVDRPDRDARLAGVDADAVEHARSPSSPQPSRCSERKTQITTLIVVPQPLMPRARAERHAQHVDDDPDQQQQRRELHRDVDDAAPAAPSACSRPSAAARISSVSA